MPEFITKDSGQREEYASGMVRDTQEGKPDHTYLPREYLNRWAMLMGRGAKKYGRDNWRASGGNPASAQKELERFKASATRHQQQWLDSFETPEDLRNRGYSEEEIEAVFSEDHCVAVSFNLAAAEYVKGRMEQKQARHPLDITGMSVTLTGEMEPGPVLERVITTGLGNL